MPTGSLSGPDLAPDEVRLVARGIATAVSPAGGLEPVQASLLGAVTAALGGVEIDFDDPEPVSAAELAAALEGRDVDYRTRIVHQMVLGELILRPLPPEVARRVADYADVLGVDDQFVRVARRYAQGAFGLAWIDLHRSGFAEHWEAARMDQLKTTVKPRDQLSAADADPELAERWRAFEHLPAGSLGHGVWELYRGRGFALPGSDGGASAYLAQHDFVHVLADYGTNLDGELEVFALIGRADPDPKGFAWLATLVGLFETGYVADAGFFTGDLRERHLDSPEMHLRIADALRRGRAACETLGLDLLEVDFHERVGRQVSDVRGELGIPEKSPRAHSLSPGVFDLEGMSRLQQEYAASVSAES